MRRFIGNGCLGQAQASAAAPELATISHTVDKDAPQPICPLVLAQWHLQQTHQSLEQQSMQPALANKDASC